MPTYVELLDQYKQHLRQAVRDYEGTFILYGRNIPQDRAQTIIALETFWGTVCDHKSLTTQTLTMCQQLRTGLFGRSELRKRIYAVVYRDDYSAEAFYDVLRQDNESLRQQLAEQLALARVDNPVNVLVLNREITQLRDENTRLVRENQELRVIIAEMRESHRKITEQNQRLAEQLQKVHVRLDKLEAHQGEEGRSSSPSSVMLSSFRGFSTLSGAQTS